MQQCKASAFLLSIGAMGIGTASLEMMKIRVAQSNVLPPNFNAKPMGNAFNGNG